MRILLKMVLAVAILMIMPAAALAGPGTLLLGAQEQPVNDIFISETAAESFKKNTSLMVSLP